MDQDGADPDGEKGEGTPGIGVRKLLRGEEAESDDKERGKGLSAAVDKDVDNRFGFELFIGFEGDVEHLFEDIKDRVVEGFHDAKAIGNDSKGGIEKGESNVSEKDSGNNKVTFPQSHKLEEEEGGKELEAEFADIDHPPEASIELGPEVLNRITRLEEGIELKFHGRC